MIKTHPAVFSLQRELSKADRKSVKNPVESDSAFLLVVCYSLIIWLCPSSSFFFEIGNLIHFFFDFAPHRWRPACLVSALSYLESEKYTPLLVKADLYAYSDAEGSFCSKDSRPDLKPSFTRHLVEKDLVNLEIWFWYRVNLFFLLLRMLVFLHSPMPVKGLRYILISSWAKEHKREWFLYKLQ